MSDIDCPGCTCPAGTECDVYITYGNRKHWFIHEFDDGLVGCDFCGLLVEGECEL